MKNQKGVSMITLIITIIVIIILAAIAFVGMDDATGNAQFAGFEQEFGDYADNFATQVSVTFDETTGVTTFQIIDPTGSSGYYRNAAKSAAYFRINAYGSGADLIVTVNQEITD